MLAPEAWGFLCCFTSGPGCLRTAAASFGGLYHAFPLCVHLYGLCHPVGVKVIVF